MPFNDTLTTLDGTTTDVLDLAGVDHAVLDDLFRYVAGVDPQEVSPNPLLNE
ncbi:MAG: hypothetical protein MI924_33280 [Chloroflexales bacterium]|nr:hypothetical protein [Chloroflexales bacterium]